MVDFEVILGVFRGGFLEVSWRSLWGCLGNPFEVSWMSTWESARGFLEISLEVVEVCSLPVDAQVSTLKAFQNGHLLLASRRPGIHFEGVSKRTFVPH